MQDVKRLLAMLAIVAVLTISVIVAFRLAPETWAVLAGIVFGLIAALPMCAIVVLMLRQRPAPPPPVETPAPAPQIILLHPGAQPDPRYGYGIPAPMQHLPAAPPPYAWPAPPAAWGTAPADEWSEAALEERAPAYPPPGRPAAPPPASRPGYRILGQ